jgi:hypothetical protein
MVDVARHQPRARGFGSVRAVDPATMGAHTLSSAGTILYTCVYFTVSAHPVRHACKLPVSNLLSGTAAL